MGGPAGLVVPVGELVSGSQSTRAKQNVENHGGLVRGLRRSPFF